MSASYEHGSPKAMVQDLRAIDQRATGNKPSQPSSSGTCLPRSGMPRNRHQRVVAEALELHHTLVGLSTRVPQNRLHHPCGGIVTAVESLQRTLRKVMNTRGSFPHEEAAMKLLPLALRHVSKSWGVLPNWKDALNRLAMLWGSASHSMLFNQKI